MKIFNKYKNNLNKVIAINKKIYGYINILNKIL